MVKYQARPKYPFVNGKQLFSNGNWWKIPASYATYHIGKHYREIFDEEARNQVQAGQNVGWGLKLARNAADSAERWSLETFEQGYNYAFPKIAAWTDFAISPSRIQHLYTVEVEGFEVPIYAQGFKQGKGQYLKGRVDVPEDLQDLPANFQQELAERVKYTLDNKESWLDKGAGEDLSNLYDQWWTVVGGDKYSRGDFPNRFEDPHKMEKWFVKDDTWVIQQYGDTNVEPNVVVDGTAYTVKRYKRPSNLMMWLYSFFDPIQRRIWKDEHKTEGSKAWEQTFIEAEYKPIAAFRRMLFSNRRPLAYELYEF